VAKYGDAAIAAVGLIASGGEKDAVGAWNEAVSRIFPDSHSSRTKSCPRGAFLGLCESGLVKGIPGGSYTRSILNKQYALEAVLILRSHPKLVGDPNQLWYVVVGGSAKRHNSQMEVVVALWRRSLIA
jgi:hypothetical protein